MAKKPQSVEDILAACRQQDGGESAGAAPQSSSPPAAETPAAEAPAEEAAAPAGSGEPLDRSKMSVADMLAAARGEKPSGGAKPAAKAQTAAESAAAAAEPAAAADRSKRSVADMLAAARGEQSKTKAAPAKPKPAAAKPAAAKPAAAQAAEPAAASGPKDTASILAAARKQDKPGPISKAEAKARGQQPPAPVQKDKPLPVMPAKPAYAQPAAAAAADTSDRRGFFGGLAMVTVGSSFAIGFASLAVTNLLWVLGLARFMFPNVLTEPPTKFKVGFPGDYSSGQVQTKFKAQYGVWIVRDEYEGEPQLFALKSVCTHLGCTPNWLEGEQKFKCPCHGSGFYKDGINFEGPAPRPLERYAIRLADDGQLEVDKSRTFQEELGQWSDPSCYVVV